MKQIDPIRARVINRDERVVHQEARVNYMSKREYAVIGGLVFLGILAVLVLLWG